jgi:hypothetical protein
MIVKKTLLPVGIFAAVGLCVGMLATNVVMVLVIGLPFKWLWNAVMPSILSAPNITYAQSAYLLGLILLVRVVVKGVKLKFDFHT